MSPVQPVGGQGVQLKACTVVSIEIHDVPSICVYNFSNIWRNLCRCCEGAGAFPNNLVQHAADSQMLCTQEEVKPAFSTAGVPKMIERIRVDGGSDEGPSHLEVQHGAGAG